MHDKPLYLNSYSALQVLTHDLSSKMLNLICLARPLQYHPCNKAYKKTHTPICSLQPLSNIYSHPKSHRAQVTKPPKDFCTYRLNYDDKESNIMLEICKFILGTVVVPFIGYTILFFLLQCTKRKNQVKLSLPESRLESESGPDVIVVGAGVAGSALAYTLGKDGRKVHVIERNLMEPKRMVGEVLQPGGYLKLVELGLQECVEDIDAQRMLGYVLYLNGKTVKLPYPLEKYHLDVAGRSFHNGRFIQRMREKAAALPNVLFNQGTVTSLIEENGSVKGVLYRTKTNEVIRAYAPLTIVCDGCFSNLRRSLCKSKVEVPSCFVGVIIKNCNLPFANHGHVILADPSPILFYPISSREIRCLVDIPGQRPPPIANGEMANYLRTMVAPQIPPELRDAFIFAVNEGNIRTMPNRVMPADPKPTPGVILLGDALNMRHPITGGGMMVALSDIIVLRDLLQQVGDLKNVNSVCRCIESFYILRQPTASTINTVAGVTYKVLSSSPDAAQQEIQQLAFNYLSLVGTLSSKPITLFSGLDTRPLNIVLNSFALAAYGGGYLLVPFPFPYRQLLGARMILRASAIIFPIIKAEGLMQIFFPGHTRLLS